MSVLFPNFDVRVYIHLCGKTGDTIGGNLVRESMEIEIKLRIESLKEARRKIVEELGARPVEPRILEDNYLLGIPSPGPGSSGRMLRLRIKGEKAFLTLKEKPMDEGEYKVREEIETEVGDGGAVLRIFEKLGFSVGLRYQKYRETFRLGDLHILLDETPPGNFIELEGSREDIDEAASRLGFTRDAYIRESYPALISAYCRARGVRAEAVLYEGGRR